MTMKLASSSWWTRQANWSIQTQSCIHSTKGKSTKKYHKWIMMDDNDSKMIIMQWNSGMKGNQRKLASYSRRIQRVDSSIHRDQRIYIARSEEFIIIHIYQGPLKVTRLQYAPIKLLFTCFGSPCQPEQSIVRRFYLCRTFLGVPF